MIAFFTSLFQTLKTRFSRFIGWFKAYFNHNPFKTLFGLLALLIILIAISSFLRTPKTTDTKKETPPKVVSVYRIGTSPKIRVQAQIEKSGVITIASLVPGVVQYVDLVPGDSIYRGQTLLMLSSNYQGGNAPAIQAQLAYQQMQNTNETYNTQKEIIAKQREVANKTDENNDLLRDISTKSIDETKSAISLNDEIIAGLDSQINAGTNVDVNRQLKSQFIGANNQLKSMLRSTEYTASSDKVPADLSNLQKDITLKNLDIQEKALNLQKEITRLQYQLALVQQQTMSPAAPFRGTVQKVFVRPGQQVNPGTPLMLISQVAEEDPVTATAYVSRDVAKRISLAEPSILMIDSFSIETYPTFVSQEAIKGSLYAVYFSIPDNYASFLTDNGYISVNIPVGKSDTGAAFPYIPIDSVYQNENAAYVYVANKNRVESRTIKLGQIFGNFVQVENGMKNGDALILDRTVVAGEKIKTNN